MLTLLKNAKVLFERQFVEASLLVIGDRVAKIGSIDEKLLAGTNLKSEIDVEVVNAKGSYIVPGLIDPHIHLSGGSGEGGGFITQSPRILVSECVRGGITTVVGTLGVDTTTKTMSGLIASVKALREGGLNAYCYTGGYDMPPQTMMGSVREDVMFIDEIIGVGEIAIADRRAPEPAIQDLARAVVDSYVGGMLSGKAGIAHFHVGDGKRRLQTARELLERHEIKNEFLYFTHVERNEGLMDEAIDIAKRGSYIDLDVCDADLVCWIRYFRNHDGPLDRLTVSSDAGVGSPVELWQQIRECVVGGEIPLEQMILHVTEFTAQALRLKGQGKIQTGAYANLVLVNEKDLTVTHVMNRGRWLMRDLKCLFPDRPFMKRRGFDLYDIEKN